MKTSDQNCEKKNMENDEVREIWGSGKSQEGDA